MSHHLYNHPEKVVFDHHRRTCIVHAFIMYQTSSLRKQSLCYIGTLQRWHWCVHDSVVQPCVGRPGLMLGSVIILFISFSLFKLHFFHCNMPLIQLGFYFNHYLYMFIWITYFDANAWLQRDWSVCLSKGLYVAGCVYMTSESAEFVILNSLIIIIISGFGIYGAAVVPDSGLGNTWQRLTLVLHAFLSNGLTSSRLHIVISFLTHADHVFLGLPRFPTIRKTEIKS